MLHKDDVNFNGIHTLDCASDYEAIDVTPFTPREAKPRWRDQHARFTEHVQWTDHEGVTHGLTIRSDSLPDLLSDLRLVKQMIRASRKQHAESKTQSKQTHDPVVPPAEVPDEKHCDIHGERMVRRWSKRTAGHYFAHRVADGSFCYGRVKGGA